MKIKLLWSFCVCIGVVLFFPLSFTQTNSKPALEWSVVYSQSAQEESLSVLEELKTTHPEKAAGIYEVIADSYVEKKDFTQALNFYQRAQELNPGSEAILSKLAGIYHEQQRPEDEIAIYRKLVSLYPNNPFYYQRLSQLLERQGKAKEVQEVWQRLLENNPYSTEACQQAASYFANKKDYAKAIQQIEKAIQLRPDEVNLRFGLASILSQAERIKDAEDLYKEIINSNLETGIKQKAINRLVILEKQQDKLKPFIAQLEARLNQGSDDINLLGQLGRAYFIDGRLDETVKIYKKIIEIKPNERTNYNQLMEIYSNQGRSKDVSEVLESMINLWPEDLSFYHRLAQIYQKDGLNELAIKTYEKALKARPNNPDSLFRLSELLLKKGEFTQAEKKLAIAVSLEPGNNEYQQKLTYAKKQIEESKQKVGRVKKEEPKKAPEKKKSWWKRLFGG